jgi:hypothetical protein
VVMKKQVDGIRRKPQKTEEVDGKTVTTEYAITGVPPFVDSGTVELGFTRRLKRGSVSQWEAHPATEIPDMIAVSEHKDHTAAVDALIAVYRNGGSPAAKAPEPALDKAADSTDGAAAPKTKAPRRAKAAAKPATRKPRGRRAAAAADPPPPGTDGGAEPQGTGSGVTGLSVVTAEAAQAPGADAEEQAWDAGYPEPNVSQPPSGPLPDPFAPGPFSGEEGGFSV